MLSLEMEKIHFYTKFMTDFITNFSFRAKSMEMREDRKASQSGNSIPSQRIDTNTTGTNDTLKLLVLKILRKYFKTKFDDEFILSNRTFTQILKHHWIAKKNSPLFLLRDSKLLEHFTSTSFIHFRSKMMLLQFGKRFQRNPYGT